MLLYHVEAIPAGRKEAVMGAIRLWLLMDGSIFIKASEVLIEIGKVVENRIKPDTRRNLSDVDFD